MQADITGIHRQELWPRFSKILTEEDISSLGKKRRSLGLGEREDYTQDEWYLNMVYILLQEAGWFLRWNQVRQWLS